MAAIHS